MLNYDNFKGINITVRSEFDQRERERMKPSIPKRAKILFIEYIVCLLVSWGLFITGLIGTLEGSDFLPASATCLLFLHLGFLTFLPYDSPFLLLGFVIVGIHIVCILAYLIRPNIITGVISFLGIVTWFFLGFVAGVYMGV